MRKKVLLVISLLTVMALAAPAQNPTPQQSMAQGQLNMLMQAQQALNAADQAGARQTATSLYEDANWRLHFAQENWNAPKESARDQARLRAEEALWAARAALAKARWIGTNNAIISLEADIKRLGGNADMALLDESPTLQINRGSDSPARVAYAQSVVDQAKAAGAEKLEGNDLKPAQQDLDTCRKIVSVNKQSESADHLAYVAEMMARRAYYLTRFKQADEYIPGLQLTRTRLAQAESERRAAAERAQRQQAEQQAIQLQQQLAAEQANRQAQAAEVERLRQQVSESRRAIQARIEADRSARLQAEQALDQSITRYESAIASGSASDVEAARRQVEDQQIALRAAQERERLNEQTMATEIEGLRAQIQATADQQILAERQAELAARQAELDRLRQDREQDLTHRGDLDRQQQAAINEAIRRRQENEAQAQAMQQQVQAAQQAAQAAQQQAAQAAAQAQQAQQSAQSSAAELEKARQQLLETQQQLTQKEAEARRAQIQADLEKLAATKREARGLIVTLSGGILFDTGKTALRPGAKTTLAKIAKELKADNDLKITVEGHTDNMGGPQKNQQLSERRAQAVRDYLIREGVPADRIVAVGKGESEPVASNKTSAGRLQNRRVELVITQ
jgi:outer membrane protein OmpA-like peptidoglycan-associated protein